MIVPNVRGCMAVVRSGARLTCPTSPKGMCEKGSDRQCADDKFQPALGKSKVNCELTCWLAKLIRSYGRDEVYRKNLLGLSRVQGPLRQSAIKAPLKQHTIYSNIAHPERGKRIEIGQMGLGVGSLGG